MTLVYKLNKHRPSTVPCRMPQVTFSSSDWVEFFTVTCEPRKKISPDSKFDLQPMWLCTLGGAIKGLTTINNSGSGWDIESNFNLKISSNTVGLNCQERSNLLMNQTKQKIHNPRKESREERGRKHSKWETGILRMQYNRVIFENSRTQFHLNFFQDFFFCIMRVEYVIKCRLLTRIWHEIERSVEVEFDWWSDRCEQHTTIHASKWARSITSGNFLYRAQPRGSQFE